MRSVSLFYVESNRQSCYSHLSVTFLAKSPNIWMLSTAPRVCWSQTFEEAQETLFNGSKTLRDIRHLLLSHEHSTRVSSFPSLRNQSLLLSKSLGILLQLKSREKAFADRSSIKSKYFSHFRIKSLLNIQIDFALNLSCFLFAASQITLDVELHEESN